MIGLEVSSEDLRSAELMGPGVLRARLTIVGRMRSYEGGKPLSAGQSLEQTQAGLTVLDKELRGEVQGRHPTCRKEPESGSLGLQDRL